MSAANTPKDTSGRAALCDAAVNHLINSGRTARSAIWAEPHPHADSLQELGVTKNLKCRTLDTVLGLTREDDEVYPLALVPGPHIFMSRRKRVVDHSVEPGFRVDIAQVFHLLSDLVATFVKVSRRFEALN